MLEPKKHINDIVCYPVDEEENWDLKLDFNENLIGPSPKVIKALRHLAPSKIKFYPAYSELISAIAKYNNVPAENIIATNGSDEGYRYIFDAYCEFGDNVLSVTPAFSMPKVYASMAHANYFEVPYQKRWEFPIDEFLKKINSSIKLVIVTTPNSPTGELISDENLEKIIKKATDSLVLIDETYANYANKTYVHYPEKYNNVIVMKSMSKDFATAGLRLGYLISNREIIQNIKRIASPYSVNSIAALAGAVSLSDENHLNKVKHEIEKSKKYLMETLKPYAKEIFKSDTNFLCVDFGDKVDYIYNKLLKAKIKIKKLSGIAKGCCRITIPPIEGSKKLIKVLEKRKPVIIFDMDGVLIDASKSYRIAIQQTFMFFSKKEVSLSKIQELKNQGGYNNDWILTQKLLTDAGLKVKYEDIVKKFNEYYFGENFDGLITHEQWLISREELEELSEKYDLAIFTGREISEAVFAIQYAGMENLFSPIITSDVLSDNEQKPSPVGIEKIKTIINGKKYYYLGDTVDDVKAGVSANVNTIGVLPPQDKSDELNSILKNNGAMVVLNRVKELSKFLEKQK